MESQGSFKCGRGEAEESEDVRTEKQGSEWRLAAGFVLSGYSSHRKLIPQYGKQIGNIPLQLTDDLHSLLGELLQETEGWVGPK